MKKSFFFKLVLIISTFCIFINGIVLFVIYNRVYVETAASVKEDLYLVADLTKEMLLTMDNGNFKLDGDADNRLDKVCEEHGVSYLYVLRISDDEKNFEYLAMGQGPSSNKDFKIDRKDGEVIKFSRNEAVMMGVYNKKKLYDFERYSSTIDETMACYMYLDEEFDPKSGNYVKVDKPIIIGAEQSMKSLTDTFIHTYVVYAVIFSLSAIFIAVAGCLVVRHRVSKPIRKISGRMDSFITDMKKDFEPLPEKGNDEFAVMSVSFNSMARQIHEYITNIEEMTRERHTREAEIDVARRIQEGLLKNNDYNNSQISVSTYMKAAKNVGGDLYEYEVLDDGRIYIMIGDVSGKGITASIFMATAITLLRQYAIHGYTPAKLLEAFNVSLADCNPEEMFITAFVALYDPSDRSLTYANAGHNPPYIVSDELMTLDGAKGLMAGIFDDEKYEEERIILKENDVVFLFTDGVNEATNNKKIYGTERLEKVLGSMTKRSNSEVMNEVLDDVKEFVSGEEQSDDITILTMQVKEG